MVSMFPKKQMSEEDIKRNFITPALVAKGWNDKMRMEANVGITAGKMKINGEKAIRSKGKRADYLLYINANNPIAVVEAKDNENSVSGGMQQAKEYAQMLDVKFAYSSNGDAFKEYDFLTGEERDIALEDFPTYEELCDRYIKEMALNEPEQRILAQPYYSSQNTSTPRYYQQIAVNRCVNRVARGDKRLLLVMATGTGKTMTAFQIVYRLLNAGLIKNVLYLADRNILVDQSILQDFSPLGKTIHKVNFQNDDPVTVTAHEVYFSLYQQLSGHEGDDGNEDEDETDNEEVISRLKALFKPGFFDMVIVDECHRGSAKKDSNWRKVLEYFDSAIQLGMTATPKETAEVSNIDYFGEPVYTYSLRQGIDDGFLAPFRVYNVKTSIEDGWTPDPHQTDKFGNLIEQKTYDRRDYDYNIVIEDRVNQVAKVITDYMMRTDRYQKTIVFCANVEHAQMMRDALIKLNPDIVKEHPDYVVRITGQDKFGKDKLPYFISVSEKFPVIATTSKLLSTGVDCKMTKLIVLDQQISSMTEFKQIIGRGTRLREQDGKTHFSIMDFRGVTRLFADPEWDGEAEVNEAFDPNAISEKMPPKEDDDEQDTGEKTKCYVSVDGCPVSIVNETVSVYDTDGSLLRCENIIDYTKRNIQGKYANLDVFIQQWTAAEKKDSIRAEFAEQGIDLEQLKQEANMVDVDDFDFVCHLVYDKKPLTRKERASRVKKSDFLSRYNESARQVLEVLLEKYMNNGIYEVENSEVLKLRSLREIGSPSKIIAMFGGQEAYRNAIQDLQTELYEVS